MNTGKGTDDTSDRGKKVKTSIEACSTVRAPGGKECEERCTHSWLSLLLPRSSPKQHVDIPK